MKDFAGNRLHIGDIVAVTIPNYRTLVRAEVIKFTPQNIRVQYSKKLWDGKEEKIEYLCPPNFVVKIADGKPNGDSPNLCCEIPLKS